MIYNKLDGTTSTSFKLGKGLTLNNDAGALSVDKIETKVQSTDINNNITQESIEVGAGFTEVTANPDGTFSYTIDGNTINFNSDGELIVSQESNNKYLFGDSNIKAFMPLATNSGVLKVADYRDESLIDVVGFSKSNYISNTVESDIQKIGIIDGLPLLDKTYTPNIDNILYQKNTNPFL
jgi:hypothetical protein